MTVSFRVTLAAVVVLGGACRDRQGESAAAAIDSTTLAEREARLSELQSAADSAGNRPLARWHLPPALAEISGIALTSDQRLLVHNDESARVFEVDYRRGVVVKSFEIGTQTLRDDFEAITTLGERVFLLASNGRVYEFQEGANGSRVRFELHDPGLSQVCEFEGLAVDSTANALVLACKNILIKDAENVILLYRYPLGGSERRPTQVRIPEREAIGSNGWKRFTPSDLCVDPASGDYLLVSAQEKGLIRLRPDGSVVWSRPLPQGHAMPEGVAITRDGLLLISDEAATRKLPGSITVYRWQP